MGILRRRALLRFAAGITVGSMILSACGGFGEPGLNAAVTNGSTVSEGVEPFDGVLSRGEGEVSHHGLTVQVRGGTDVVLSLPTLNALTAEALSWLVGQGIAISPPMLVTTDATGGTLIKEFPEPLPQGWDAGFMTVDEESGELAVIEGVLSADRRSMTAQVEHFSNWWDYLTPSEIGETMRVGRSATVRSAKELGDQAVDVLTEPAEKVDYFVGGVLATRVDPPTCSGAVPSWVQDTIFIETHFNNPIHFCTGSAPQDSDILEVKVRINRGFGMTVTAAAPPVSASNTTYSGIGDGVAAFAADVAQSMANGMGPLLEGGSFLGAGHEATLRFDESSVRSAGSGPVVTVNAPSTLSFAASSLAGALTAAGLSQMDATSLAVAGVASCSADMMAADSGADSAFGTAKCGMTYLSDNADQLASATAGAVSSTALRRAYLVLTAVAASHNYVAYQLSRKMEEGGRTVTVITTPQLQSSTAMSALPVLDGIPEDHVIVLNAENTGGLFGFASPSGQLSCTFAPLHFGQEPYVECQGGSLTNSPDDGYCSEGIGVAGVTVARKAGWYCSGGVTNGGSGPQSWAERRGFPTVIGQSGMAEAVLPYGWALTSTPITCVSRTSGVTCENTATGARFTTNRSESALSGPIYSHSDEFHIDLRETQSDL